MIRRHPTTKQCALSVVLFAFSVVLFALAVVTPASAGSGDLDSVSTHQSAQSAADFIRSLYVGYAPGKPVPNPSGPQSRQIFAQSTLTLIQKDQEVPQGEVGALDYDPICDCQDYENIHNVVVTTAHGKDGQTTVTARFSNGGRKKTVRFDIVSERGGWRIYDIHASLAPSLRKLLGAR